MKSPFKFLDSYTKDDREIFFGREREIEELYHRVFESKIMLVYGVSGTGKSSLIHCGLANKFQDTDWLPIPIRRGGNIIESMAAGISSASITEQQTKLSTPADFKKGVRSLYLDHYKPVFFIFDQFEELFIFGDKEERRSFIHIVKTLTESDLQCRMIFIMREEYMAGVTEFERFIPTFFSNRVRIEKMSHRNAIEAIKGPCNIFNISLEEGFAESLLEKLSPGSEDVELTYMQVFLDKIFRIATGSLPPPGGESKGGSSPAFTLAILQKTGNVTDLLGSFLDEQVTLLDNPEKGLAVLKSFVSVKGTKKQMSPGEVSEYSKTLGKPIDEESLQELLQTFINLRILREKDQNGKYELRHDALATKIYEKISLVEKEILEIRSFIENSYNSWQKRRVLLSPDDLNYVAPYESRLFLPAEYNDLISKSKKELEKKKRQRLTIAVSSVSVILIIFACFTIWALIERKKSNEQENTARANYLNSLSKEFRDSDPTKAFKLAEFATKLNPSDEIRRNLIEIYSDNEFYHSISAQNPIFTGENNFQLLNKSGRIAVVESGKIIIHDDQGKAVNKQYYDYEGFKFSFSPDETSCLIYAFDDTVRLFDNKRTPVVKIPLSMEIANIWQVNMDFFSYSSYFYLCVLNEVEIWSSTGKLVTRSNKFQNGLFVIPRIANNEVIICSAEGTIYTWNILTDKINETKIILDEGLRIAWPVLLNDGNIGLYRSDKRICIYDKGGRYLRSWQTDHTVAKVLSAPDKDIIVTSDETKISIWNYNGDLLKSVKSGFEISDVQYDQDRNRLVFSSMVEILFYPLSDLQNPILFKTSNPVAVDINSGSLFEFNLDTKECKKFDFNGNLLEKIRLPDHTVKAFLSASGNFIACTNYSKPFLTVIDLENDSRCDIDAISYQSGQVSFSPDNKYILTSGYLFTDSSNTSISYISDNEFELWTTKGKLIKSVKCNNYVNSISFSNDNSHILVASGKDAIVYDTSGTRLKTLSGHTDIITDFTISEDGQYYLTGSYDGTTILWSTEGKLISIIQQSITTPFDNRMVSFLKGQPLFMTYTPFSNTFIQIFDLKGELVQSIPGYLSGRCHYSAQDNSIIFYDLKKESVLSARLKIPVDSFALENNYKTFTVPEKVEYGMISIEEILKTGSSGELYSMGVFLMDYKVLSITDKKEKLYILKTAEKLFNKGLLSDTIPGKIYRRLSDLYLQNSYIQDKDISRKLDYIFKKMTETVDYDELTLAADYYNALINNSTLQYGFPEKVLNIYKKIYENCKGHQKIVGESCSNLSFRSIEMKDFKTALEAVLISVESDPSNPYIYTNLPLAYLLNDHWKEAEQIYSEWKDKPWKEDRTADTYSGIFLLDIDNLENKGITHPDFEKVKELLKE